MYIAPGNDTCIYLSVCDREREREKEIYIYIYIYIYIVRERGIFVDC